MTNEALRILMIAKLLPARLGVFPASVLLGVQEHDIPVLVAARLLTPLGHPSPSSPKYFATVTLLALTQDERFLHRCTLAIATHWARKRARKIPKGGNRKFGNGAGSSLNSHEGI